MLQMKKQLIAALILLAITTSVKAQDPIFTQYFIVPVTLNPGFTGFMETTNIGVLHRTQWPDLNFKVDTEYAFYNTWIDEMNSGVGISVLNHRENFTNYNFTQVNLNYAYKVQLNDDWFFRPALEIGFGNKTYGFQNILLSDQININTGIINPNSNESLPLKDKVLFFDFNAGILFNTENSWIGLSIKHLNKPNISFSTIGNLPLGTFLSVSSGREVILSDYFYSNFASDSKLLLTANYMQQGEYNRLDLGTGLIFKNIFVGTTAAIHPQKSVPESHMLTSVNVFGGLRFEHFKYGFSYDFSTSKIGKTGGIYELSVTYQLNLDANCFGCPTYY